MSGIQLSIVIASYNRRAVVLHTLERIAALPDRIDGLEIIVVDNASTDGTAAALRGRAGVRLLQLRENLGSCAKARGVAAARGEFLLFLDDDSYPDAGALQAMVARFAGAPDLGALGFRVRLENGQEECSALPHVFVGCGVGLRAKAVRGVGGLDASFFMQAEEYDLAWRLLGDGWRVEIATDLFVEHLKSPQARRSERTTLLDVRNNLRIVERYLPEPARGVYRADWLQRYAWLARHAQQLDAFDRGVREAAACAKRERCGYANRRMSARVFEALFGWNATLQRMRRLRHDGVRRIALIDVGKNVYAFHRAAQAAGVRVLCIGTDWPAAINQVYRGTRIVPMQAALAGEADAFVISNSSYAHAARRRVALATQTSRPVHSWYELSDGAGVRGAGIGNGANLVVTQR